ncbi:hypothetical protein GQ43DRAFT_439297 [Delitschia confertaspora ATCC 74209]|uniref:Uncharacterized protein n=1 Tax=Delitschia confertaspora ATCC 74209 TaxID=1513339 RepID=A0A9P4JPP9_9PLEO|nr:hypothetical protein GQ43DRAFT_439297 [Delitschia confertaspora ATCC 74209]
MVCSNQTRSLLFRAPFLRSSTYHPTSIFQPFTRPLSNTTILSARKNTQDKDSLDPSRSEYSQSGTDDAATATTDAAFNPNKTSPESEKAAADKESGRNTSPLDVSPGNPEVSKARDPQEGGSAHSPKTTSGTGAGNGKKAGGSKSG